MAEKTNFEIFRNTAVILRFQLVTPEPEPDYVMGWTTIFTVRQKNVKSTLLANAVISVAGSLAGIPNSLEYGIFEVSLSAAHTALLQDKTIYNWSFKRDNFGFEDVLALGELKASTTA